MEKSPKHARQFEKQKQREELFKVTDDLPDIFLYEREARRLTEFGRETEYYSPFHFERQGPNRPPVQPVKVEHDQTKVLAGLEELSSTKKTKTLVTWDKQKVRDDMMYGFNKTDVQALLRRINKKEIKFSDTLPNNMERRRPGSRVDMSQASFAPNTTALELKKKLLEQYSVSNNVDSMNQTFNYNQQGYQTARSSEKEGPMNIIVN